MYVQTDGCPHCCFFISTKKDFKYECWINWVIKLQIFSSEISTTISWYDIFCKSILCYDYMADHISYPMQ